MASLVATTGAEHRFIVLASYRHLLRAFRISFKDDIRTLDAARHQARTSFRATIPKSEGPGTPLMAQRIEEAQGVTKILRENVVQGRRVDKPRSAEKKAPVRKISSSRTKEESASSDQVTKPSFAAARAGEGEGEKIWGEAVLGEAGAGQGEEKEESATYRLRFTEDTQRFDNEDTKKLKGTTKSFKEIKNALF